MAGGGPRYQGVAANHARTSSTVSRVLSQTSSQSSNVASPSLHGNNKRPLSAAAQHTATNKRKEREFEKSRDQESLIENKETNIQVVLRCRGRNEREIRENSSVVVSAPDGARGRDLCVQTSSSTPLSNKIYTFDRVFGPEADQEMVFDDVVQPMLEEVLSGYNCTVFAYGQTGTGKTYTMSGDVIDILGSYSPNAGIIPRTLYKLFSALDAANTEYSVKCSFIELYNEDLRDLLSIDEEVKLRMFEDSSKRSVLIQGMEEVVISSAADGVKYLQSGTEKRQVAATRSNEFSSRSHTVFTILVHIKETAEGDDVLRVGKLNLVDLAGSENISRSGAENKRAREAGMINQSLLTLGRVINALVEHSPHIPYRESKLTRLLQDSLGGRTKTCIIATVSPARVNLEETVSTLDYAYKAKNIHNKPQMNKMMTKKALIKDYIMEIEKLKHDLIASRQKTGVYLSNETYEELTLENESRRVLLDEKERKTLALENSLKATREQFEQNIKLFMETKSHLEKTHSTLNETRQTLGRTEQSLFHVKQNLAEETVLRKAHQATETNLDDVAQNLKSKLDESVGDIFKLHAKVERKSHIESHNKERWSELQSLMGDQLALIETRIDDFAKSQLIFSDSMTGRLTGFIVKEMKRLTDNYQYVEGQFRKFNEQQGKLTDSLGDSRTQAEAVVGEIKALREEVKGRLGEGLKGLNKAAERIAGEVVGELIEFQQQINASYNQLGHEIKFLFDDTNRHIRSQTQEIVNLKTQLAEASQRATCHLTTTSDNLKEAIEEETLIRLQERDHLLKQISCMVCDIVDSQERRLNGRIFSIQNGLIIATQEAGRNAVQQSDALDVLVEKEAMFSKKIHAQKEDVKRTMVRAAQTADVKGLQIQQSTRAIHAETTTLVETQIQDVDVQMAALDEFVVRAGEQIVRGHDLHSQLVEASGQTMWKAQSTLSSELGGMKKDVEIFGRDGLNTSEDQKPFIRQFCNTALENFSSLRHTLTSAAISEDTSTGQTPRKKEYPYPSTWNLTRPHDEMLAHLRRTPLGKIDPNKTSNTPNGILLKIVPPSANSQDVPRLGENENDMMVET
ncbi:Kinesin-like protein bimC [Neolecta irregularis DAH-3]|uniref:Kinesin-like protein bimC n=1 Tax=Neolecta irregularis (strain DAH-3) TaxID=1198029 RepID=A0A1U7LQX0_NEOID|nr:Kinesin-like protein bimC [Neolecta irregularis DAH-3]|eukprot:OLL25029.1 Kinesin-like protein bimC [Neolecta irregularis DAH-3]